MRSPLLLRALSIGAVALLILAPILAIEGKITERRQRAESVAADFQRETSGPQAVVGPILLATCQDKVTTRRETAHGTAITTDPQACGSLRSTPRALDVQADVRVERVHRGIYPISLYHAQVRLRAQLVWPAAPVSSPDHERRWDQVYAVFVVSDPRGIKSFAEASGAALDAGTREGFTLAVPLGPHASRAPGSIVSLDYRLALAGTGSLQVAPIGQANHMRWISNWPHPSFGSAWAPDERRVSRAGFEADWNVSGLATRGRADWATLGADQLAAAPAVSVSFMEPGNPYALSYRATQYAFLFVLFTFAALALTETLAAIRLHPVHYLLVGSAIAVFFLLLIALSEHVGFRASYASAALACVALLLAYLRHPLGSSRRTAAFGALFTVLYAMLYGVLMSEDNALLLGSLLVFAMLSAVMLATRKLDWNDLSARMASGQGARA